MFAPDSSSFSLGNIQILGLKRSLSTKIELLNSFKIAQNQNDLRNSLSTHPLYIHGDRYFAFFGRQLSLTRKKKTNQANKEAIFNPLANQKKDSLRIEIQGEKSVKRKKTKQIAKVSDFADKLFRLNMIVSYKPNLSVVYGWLIQTVGFTNSLWNVKSFYWCRLLW